MLRHDHECQINIVFLFFDQFDDKKFVFIYDKNSYRIEHHSQITLMIVITTSFFYKNNVKNRISHRIKFERILNDEIHLCKIKNIKIVNIFFNLNTHARK